MSVFGRVWYRVEKRWERKSIEAQKAYDAGFAAGALGCEKVMHERDQARAALAARDGIELAAAMDGEAVEIEVHYHGGVGYWARVNGADAGEYERTWDELCDRLRDVVPALVAASQALTVNEADVLGVVRRQARHGDPVAAGTVHGRSSLTYDQVNRALTHLVAKGLLSKPSRGFYLPTA